MTKKIVTIGGGTGQYMVLRELKKHDLDITAIVAMGDSGGSSGVLRVELGVLPPGDIRQALVALSDSSELLRELFIYRFDNGGLNGHSFGNLFLSALEKITGSLPDAIEQARTLLSVNGRVIPSSLESYHLIADMPDGQQIIGEGHIDTQNTELVTQIYLDTQTSANPDAIDAILSADYVVYCPGTFHCSLVPHVLLQGMSDALAQTNARKILITNLMTTNNLSVSDYIDIFNQYAGVNIIDWVICNTGSIKDADILAKYTYDGELLVQTGNINDIPAKIIGADLIDHSYAGGLVRHDAPKLVDLILGTTQD